MNIDFAATTSCSSITISSDDIDFIFLCGVAIIEAKTMTARSETVKAAPFC